VATTEAALLLLAHTVFIPMTVPVVRAALRLVRQILVDFLCLAALEVLPVLDLMQALPVEEIEHKAERILVSVEVG
jgi:hypothetical protein